MGFEFRYKQALVVRTDLDMGKGKIAAQVGHAVIMASEEAKKQRLEWWREWFDEGQCKVVLKVSSSEELGELEKKARALGMPTAKIQDRGLTQLEPGTMTCIGIGPAPSHLVDEVTGKLKLL
ncbi:MAG: peptidyl-tRNA hydrolase Pth2 [archaeon]